MVEKEASSPTGAATPSPKVCPFCEIVHSKLDEHKKTGDQAILIEDHKPKAPYHFLVLSKAHISKPTDLTVEHIPLLQEMNKLGREHLRQVLKDRGDADTVEDMLRIGFHFPPLLSVHHLHMHFLYPIKDMSWMSNKLLFRPGKVFHTLDKVLEDLQAKSS